MAFDVATLGIDVDNLPTKWTLGRLDSLASLNPEQLSAAYPHSQIAYLDIANVSAGVYGEPVVLSLAGAPSRAKRVVRARDTILSTVRPGNRAFAFVKHAANNLVASTGFAVLRSKPNADPRFVYYLATSDPIITYLASIAEEKTAYPSVNPRDIAECTIPIPPLPEQRAIAHILGTLGDKIELNRRMSKTLEAMARALFKSWFVDFDPVRAKAEGRNPNLPKFLADLFPVRLVDSELGEIPEGWNAGTLGAVAESPHRGIQPEQIESERPYIALEHMPKRCIALSDWGTADGLESNKFEFKTGEILFGKLRPYFHKVGIAPVDGVCSTDIVVVVPRSDDWFGFVLCHVSSTAFVEYTNAGSTGTKMPRTSWGYMERYSLAIPPPAVARAFTNQVRPAVDRIIAGIHESRTLAGTRDSLLPKLVSGELRVINADEIIEATT